MSADPYQLVQLRNGTYSLHSSRYAETMHPGLGPAAEAEALYVRQLDLPDRLRRHVGDFVIWDVGLGAAANALSVLRASRDYPVNVVLHSFDHSLDPLCFAFEHKESLGYFEGYETYLQRLLNINLQVGRVTPCAPSTACVPAAGSGLPALPIRNAANIEFEDGSRKVRWHLHLADFPGFLKKPEADGLPRPHVVLFDAFSPARNPEMWTLPLFADLFHRLAPSCILVTYSRSTMVRAALLLAGFFVGRGEPSGLKEETTVAANDPRLLKYPFDAAWLQRARKSGSAEPLVDGTYRQAPLAETTWQQLQAHPQFS